MKFCFMAAVCSGLHSDLDFHSSSRISRCRSIWNAQAAIVRCCAALRRPRGCAADLSG